MEHNKILAKSCKFFKIEICQLDYAQLCVIKTKIMQVSFSCKVLKENCGVVLITLKIKV